MGAIISQMSDNLLYADIECVFCSFYNFFFNLIFFLRCNSISNIQIKEQFINLNIMQIKQFNLVQRKNVKIHLLKNLI